MIFLYIGLLNLLSSARLGLRWADGGPDVVHPSPQSLISSSTGTTSPEPKGPEASRTWCTPPR